MNLQGPRRRTAPDAHVRRLLRALALSAALHALVLWPAALPVPNDLGLAPAVLQATLKPVPPAAPVAAPAGPPARIAEAGESRPPTAGPPRPAARKAAAPAAERLLVLAAKEGERRVAAAPPVEPAADTALASPAAAAPVAAASAGDPAAEAQSGAAIDAESLRQFRFAVSLAVRKDYPSLARERGWTGTARVRLAYAADAVLPRVDVVASSGHVVLDRAARAMIDGAARETPLPPGLRGRDFSIDLPVKFGLEEAD
jgi:protein TonB